MDIKIANKKVHFVSVNGILLSDKLVTYDLWTSVMSDDVISLVNTHRERNYPIYGIRFVHIIEFLNILNKKSDSHYENLYFDILNMNEWNKVSQFVRDDLNKKRGIDSFAWINENSQNKVHKVAQKKSISGLYDFFGNVMEWCYSEGGLSSFDGGEIQPALGGSYDDTLDECFEPRFVGNDNQFNEIVGFRLGLFSRDQVR